MNKTPKYLVLLLVLGTLIGNPAIGQQELTWYNPVSSHIQAVEGQAWPGEVTNLYQRLPDRAEELVRLEVWNLSQHAAGMAIRFRTDASEISIRYMVAGNMAMPHMPATGVSGVDLYGIDVDGNWRWCRPGRKLSDTVSFTYKGITSSSLYHLYLPLYNHVRWLQIGVSKDASFEFMARREKPIVIYGTSIAQGACASRPGMAWTNIVSRKLDYPIINLAFSGNGRLEPELINLIGEIDAGLFVLDCLPNLTNAELYDHQELSKRIKNAVRQLRAKHPETPILLTEHAGYTDGQMQPARQQAFERVNQIQQETYQQLLQQGYSGLYYLSYQELGLQMDDMVDGTHPNDLGMMRYAEAYEKKLREIPVD